MVICLLLFFCFLFFFSVKRKLCSCLEKAWGFIALLMLDFAGLGLTWLFIEVSVRFKFHLLINRDLWYFYDWKFIRPNFAYSWLNGALYFSLKNLSCGKKFFNQFRKRANNWHKVCTSQWKERMP